MALLNPIRWSPMSCLPYGPSFNYLSGRLELGNGESELVSRTNISIRMTKPSPLYHEDQRVAQVASLIPAQVFTHTNTQQGSEISSTTGTNNKTEFTTGWIQEDDNLVCAVTTHRLILYSPNNPNQKTSPIRQIPYEGIESVSADGGKTMFSKGTPYKLILSTRNFGLVQIEFPSGSKHVMSSSMKQRDEMMSHVQKSIYLRFSKHDLNHAGRFVSTPNC